MVGMAVVTTVPSKALMTRPRSTAAVAIFLLAFMATKIRRARAIQKANLRNTLHAICAYPTPAYARRAMNLDQLRAFIVLAERRTFVEAARRLGLSQPTLSRQMQALEEELGAKLLVRTPRGVALTDSGARFLSRAREAAGGPGRPPRCCGKERRSCTSSLACREVRFPSGCFRRWAPMHCRT